MVLASLNVSWNVIWLVSYVFDTLNFTCRKGHFLFFYLKIGLAKSAKTAISAAAFQNHVISVILGDFAIRFLA